MKGINALKSCHHARYKIRPQRSLNRSSLVVSSKMRFVESISIAILLLFFSSTVLAQKKVALVIGNSKYDHVEYLPNPINDAKDVADRLSRLGFEIVHGIDMSGVNMKRILRNFRDKLDRDTVAVFYYAGHGIQKDGRNYLIPVNADISESYEIEHSSVDLNLVLSALNEANPILSIALIDACRDNPFERRIKGLTRSVKSQGKGLAAVDSAAGVVLSFATEPGKTAVDGYGVHSPYTEALLKFIGKPGLSVQEMLNEVGLEVMSSTDGDQKPWYASSPIPRYCFAGCTSNLPSEDSQVASELKVAIENHDLANIKQLVMLNDEQEILLQGLFTVYSKLRVETLLPTHPSIVGRQNKITVNIQEAINHQGNRIIPSEKWQYITFNIK